MRLLAEQVFHHLLNARHAGLSAHQHNFVDLARVHAGILQRLLARLHRPLNQVLHQRLQLRARQLLHQMLRTRSVRRNERQVDLSLHRRGELDLRFLRRILQTLQRHLVALGTQVKTFVLLELIDQPLHNALVNVVAAQVCITVGRLHFNDAFADFKNRNVERTAAEVIDRDGLVLLLVQAVRQCCRRRLIHNALDVKAGNLTGVFCRLPLRVVEVGRNGNDGLRH